MSTEHQAIYTLRVTTAEQVDDLRDLWQESLVAWDREKGLVRVMSDPIGMYEFLLFYELYVVLEGAGSYLPPRIQREELVTMSQRQAANG